MADPTIQDVLDAIAALDVELVALDALIDLVKAKTDTIGSLAVTVVSPVAESGDITVYAGDDLIAAAGTQLDVDITSGTILTKDWTSATCVLCWSDESLTGAVSSITVGKRLRFTAAASVTALWDAGAYDYSVEVEFVDHVVVTIARGTLTVVADIP